MTWILFGSILVAFASGISTLWTRWIAVTTAAFLALVYLVPAGWDVAREFAKYPSCSYECPVSGALGTFFTHLFWVFLLLVVLLLGVRIADLVREA